MKGDLTAAGSDQPRSSLEPGPRFGISRTGGTVIVSVHGAVDADRWSTIDAVLGDLIDAQGNLDVVLDLSDVACLERDAVPLIVHAAHQAHSHGGRLRLADQACRDRWSGPAS